MQDDSFSENWRVIGSVFGLVEQHRECDACHALFSQALEQLAMHIEARAQRWGSDNLLVSEILERTTPGGTKRRRVEQGVREAIMRKAAEKNATGPSVIAGATGIADPMLCYKWRLSDLARFRGSCLAEYKEGPRTCHSVFDAARVGKPARDWLIHLFWDPQCGLSAPLAPTALRFQPSKRQICNKTRSN